MKTAEDIRRHRLRQLVEEHGGSASAARVLDRSPSQVSQWLNASIDPKTGKPRVISPKSARMIERAFGKREGWLDQHGGAQLEPGPAVRGRIPVISWVQAGSFSAVVDNLHPGEADEWADTTVAVKRHTYALRVRGDSMTNPDGEPTFQDGQIIVVEPDAIDSPDRLVGKFVIVKRAIDNEATFKRLTKDAGVYYLTPLNPRYKLIELHPEDTICGVVLQKVVNY